MAVRSCASAGESGVASAIAATIQSGSVDWVVRHRGQRVVESISETFIVSNTRGPARWLSECRTSAAMRRYARARVRLVVEAGRAGAAATAFSAWRRLLREEEA